MVFLNQAFRCEYFSPRQMDALWAEGWRHFGEYFFRYSIALHNNEMREVIPLRIDLSRVQYSKSQKRIISKNRDLRVIIRDTYIDREKIEMFLRHRERFAENIPESLDVFLSDTPADVPCRNKEIAVYCGEKLVAASFLDVGEDATSAVYAMFEPAESRRSLGIFMMLTAIGHSRDLNCRYYYPGYAFRGSSVYDYKKRFTGLERLDWDAGNWKPETTHDKNTLGHSKYI